MHQQLSTTALEPQPTASTQRVDYTTTKMPYRITLTDPNSRIIALHRFAADHIISQHPEATSTYLSFSSGEWAALKQVPASPVLLARKKDVTGNVTGSKAAKSGNSREKEAQERPRNGKEQKKGRWAAFKRAWRASQERTRVDTTTAQPAAPRYFAIAWAVDASPAPEPVVEGGGKDSLSTDLLSGAGEVEDPFGDVYEVYSREESKKDWDRPALGT